MRKLQWFHDQMKELKKAEDFLKKDKHYKKIVGELKNKIRFVATGSPQYTDPNRAFYNLKGEYVGYNYYSDAQLKQMREEVLDE